MVSTHQQYLCPDYLPLSSSVALDSNKSPLALLAQTCNSIGLPESSSTTSGAKSKTTNSDALKLSCKDENNKNHATLVKATNQPADSTSDASANCHSNGYKNGHHHKKSNYSSLSNNDSSPQHHHQRPNSLSNENDVDGNKRESSSVSSSGGSGVKAADTSTGSGGADSKFSNSADSMTSSSSALKCVVTLPMPPTAFPANFAYASHCFPSTSSTTASVGSGVFPLFGGHNQAALPLSFYPPYHLSPAAASLPTLFPRLCTDPFCKSCPPNPAFSGSFGINGPLAATGGARPCPLGCAQCNASTHPDLSFWLNSYSSLINMQQHGGLSAAAALAVNPMSAVYTTANPFLSGLYNNNNNNNVLNGGQSTVNAGGHVCNWLNGDKYCGKIFPSAEELLQHLRGHTHETSTSTSTTNNGNAASASTSTLASASPTSTASGRLSPRSAYLSSLHSLRYHPYGKAAASVLPPHLSFPPLNPSATAFGLQSVLFAGQQQRLPHS